MRPKSGLPKRKALRNLPQFSFGFRNNPKTECYRNLTLNDGKHLGYSKILSLFCGAGGFDLGFLGGFNYLGKLYPKLPFQIEMAIDIDEKSVKTYNTNLSIHAEAADLTQYNVADIPRADIVLGGFPCQDFSSCGPKKGFNGYRGELYTVLRDYMSEHQPLIAIGENVPFLEKLSNGDYINKIMSEFSSTGYKVNLWKLNCPLFGLPQSRTRLFIVCVRKDLPGFPLSPRPTHAMGKVTSLAALQDLEPITDESVTNQSQYFVATKATKGAGQGDQTTCANDVSYTVRANPKGRVQFHYKLDRRLTVRECARLQSFPDEFVFPHSASSNIMQIGNAVPPIIGHHVASQISKFIKSIEVKDEVKIAS